MSERTPAPVAVERHPPERRGPRVVTAHCGCCCCCCCCLHSVGGLIAAALGSVPVPDDSGAYYVHDEENPDQYRRVSLRRGRSVATAWYWLVLVLLCLAGASGGLAWFDVGPNDVGWFWVFFYLPAVQLAASAVTLLAVLVAGGDRRELWQLTRITGAAILGAILGTLVMLVMCGGWGIFR